MHPPSPSPHPASPRCPLHSISQTFHFCLSLFLHSLPYPSPAHVGKYICRQQKAHSLPLPLSFLAPSLFLSLSLSLPLPLRHPTHVISTGCLSHAPAFQPAAANKPLCERSERERERGREERNLVTVRKLNLERLSACYNKALGTLSVALKWKITSLSHTPAPRPPPLDRHGAQGSLQVSGLKQKREPFHSSRSTSVDDDCEALLPRRALKGIALPLSDAGQSSL